MMASTRTTIGPDGAATNAEAGAGAGYADVRKPLFASVGAADLAVEKLAALPTMYGTEVKKLSGRVVGLPTQAQTVIRTLPATVGSQLADLQVRANQLYDSFADRGERRVASIRRTSAARDAAEQEATTPTGAKAGRGPVVVGDAAPAS